MEAHGLFTKILAVLFRKRTVNQISKNISASYHCLYLLKRIHLPDHIISRTWSTWNWFLLVVINVIPFSPIQCTTRPDFNKVPLVPPPLVLHGFLVN